MVYSQDKSVTVLSCQHMKSWLFRTVSIEGQACPNYYRMKETAPLKLSDVINVSFPELYYDRGNHHEFVSLVKDLARPGELTQSQTFDFEFTHVEKPYESYTGQNVKLR